ncbi:Hypothetical predicted protein [Pelobates cultripes]|uniref:Uncharacterized protein n=1 Tax=Pelobates cultripes TaxID=61616 RepID=A0AAD1W0I7_PELCU|nr:Hypothetical predicted protein [Pelobates cultripes]
MQSASISFHKDASRLQKHQKTHDRANILPDGRLEEEEKKKKFHAALIKLNCATCAWETNYIHLLTTIRAKARQAFSQLHNKLKPIEKVVTQKDRTSPPPIGVQALDPEKGRKRRQTTSHIAEGWLTGLSHTTVGVYGHEQNSPMETINHTTKKCAGRLQEYLPHHQATHAKITRNNRRSQTQKLNSPQHRTIHPFSQELRTNAYLTLPTYKHQKRYNSSTSRCPQTKNRKQKDTRNNYTRRNYHRGPGKKNLQSFKNTSRLYTITPQKHGNTQNQPKH